MTQRAREWIPESALTDPSLLSELDAEIAAWSGRWFARPVERVGGPIPRGVGKALTDRNWRSFAPGVTIAWSKAAAHGLARNALALGELVPKATEADERLLSYYAERIARELAGAILHLLGPVESDADEGVEFQLRAAGNGPALSLRISEPALAAFRKRRCRPFAPPPIAKAPLAQVLAASRIEVEAVLGHARVSMQDLQNIATGDVIVLETGADDPVRLESTLTRTIVASAELARADGVLQLRIR